MMLLQAIPAYTNITTRTVDSSHYAASISIAAFAFIKLTIGIFRPLLVLVLIKAYRTKVKIAVFIKAFPSTLGALAVYPT